ncbi:MAG: HEAT repeat domain-containing protein [Candidatus Neomarinimicrobiota bacterium]
MVLKVPSGSYRFEITTRSSELSAKTMGAFDFASGNWHPPVAEPLHAGSTEVSISAEQLKVIEIQYDDPMVGHGPESGDEKRTVYLWRNFRLVVTEGGIGEIPQEAPEVHALTKEVSITELGERELIAGLQEDLGLAAAGALLRIKNLNTELIISALEETPLELNVAEARVLAKAVEKRAVEPLIRCLEEGSEVSRYLAAWTLGELQDRRAVEPLIKALKAESVIIRSYAAYALARIKDTTALDALIEAVSDRACVQGMTFQLLDYEIYTEYLLGSDYKAVGPVLPIPYFCVARNAIYALGQLRDPRAIEPLIEYLDIPDNNIQLSAIMALSLYRGERVVDALLAKLASEQAVRWLAVKALQTIGDEKALSPLEQLSQADPDSTMRQAAVEAIEMIKASKPE